MSASAAPSTLFYEAGHFALANIAAIEDGFKV